MFNNKATWNISGSLNYNNYIPDRITQLYKVNLLK